MKPLQKRKKRELLKPKRLRKKLLDWPPRKKQRELWKKEKTNDWQLHLNYINFKLH